MKQVNLSILFSSLLVSGLSASGLDYLNSLRVEAGLVPFQSETRLEQAAKNHSQYLQTNNTSGHFEDSNKQGFTGATPSDRVVYANYPTKMVIENVSTGDNEITKSIDALFSAIYHRFGFLDIAQDEIGIGVSDTNKHYTYDFGNRAIRKLCEDSNSYSGGDYVYKVCSDENKKIDVNLFEDAVNAHKKEAPELIIWPPNNSDNILPVFFSESPDPLPDYSVSGYPVSVQFNDLKFKTAPTVKTFSLESDAGDVIEPITIMNYDNDPNHRFSHYQFALFPKKRLEWGSRYYVNFSYSYDGNEYDKQWCFSTISLNKYAQRVYRVEGESDVSLDVVSGRSYAIYLVPKDGNDIFHSYSFSYSSSVSVDVSYIDYNTLYAKVDGAEGGEVDISLSNGQKIHLRVSSSDRASTPKDERCEDSSSNSGSNSKGSTDTDGQDDYGSISPNTDSNRGDNQAKDSSESGTDGDKNSNLDFDEDKAKTPTQKTEIIDEKGQEQESIKSLLSTGLTLEINKLEDNSLECKIGRDFYEGTYIKVDLKSTVLELDSSKNATITPFINGKLDLKIIAYNNGKVKLLSNTILNPKTPLPLGTTVDMDEERLRVVVPLKDELEF